MAHCRSSCLVPLSQVPEGTIPKALPTRDGIPSHESYEVVLSYTVDSPFKACPESEPLPSPHADLLRIINSPAYTNENHTTSVHSQDGPTCERLQASGIAVLHTPKKMDATPELRPTMTPQAPPDAEFTNSANRMADSEIQRLTMRGIIGKRAVNVDVSTIERRIMSKVLQDAEARQVIVTFVRDRDDCDEDDHDEVDHEFEMVNASGSRSINLNDSLGYALDRIDGNLFDVPSPKTPINASIPVDTSDIDWFNSTMRFNKIKEYKKHAIPFSGSDNYYHGATSCTMTDSEYNRNKGTLFKDSPKRDEYDDDYDDESDDLMEPPAEITTAGDQTHAVMSPIEPQLNFLKKRKREKTEHREQLSSDGAMTSKSLSRDSTTSSISEGSGQLSHRQRVRRHISHDNCNIMIDEYKNHPDYEEDSDSSPQMLLSDMRAEHSNTSLDRSLSHSRHEGSGSLPRDCSVSNEGISKRGRLVESRRSAESNGGVKALRSKHGTDRVFDNALLNNKDWSSETWGSFINVILSRTCTLGHGSFSTVTFAFLRLTPSLAMNGGRPNSSCSNENIAMALKEYNAAAYRDSNRTTSESEDETFNGQTATDSRSAPTDPKSGNATGNNGEGDIIDQMCSVVSGHCSRCANVRAIDCAVKSINDVFPQARFQYIREKEMMLHFNANVLKPLACRHHNTDGNRSYQLLMPKAQGDLLDMLKRLVKHRTNTCTSQVYIASQSTGKQERKIIGLNETEVKFLFYQVLSGLAFIQMCFQGNIHRHSDIKLQNILVLCRDEDQLNPMRWRLCLADFGCSIMLHPTQHLEGAGLFRTLHDSLSKEWRTHVCNQLTSFVRGTVRSNAPEALSYDRHGKPRSNHNDRLLTAYKRRRLRMSYMNKDQLPMPRVWVQGNVSEEMKRLPPRSAIRVPGVRETDTAEYYTVDMHADMWSAGIVLAELAKFGGPNPCSDDSRSPNDSSKSKGDTLPADYVNQRLNGTLGRGIFCRNNAVVKLKMQLEAAREKGGPKASLKVAANDKAQQNSNQAALTDENLNMALATDIAAKCDQETVMRVRKLKREYCWWEYPKFSSGFWSLLANLLSYDPAERYIAAEAMGHAWFESSDGDSRPIFDDIDALMAEQHQHLPMEHFFYIGSSLSLHSGYRKGPCNNESSPFTVKREALMHVENSDVALESVGDYGKAGRTSHAWFAGPLHFRLRELHEPGVDLPDYVAQICQRETIVLESREKELFGTHGFVLAQLLALRRRYMFSWSEMMSARAVHLLGKSLMLRDYAQR
ncbi:protein kinase domain containing protein, putative [Babesia bigemina]|uniref:Protein kinase domain containing protein, putative n=1 Tax=Babesia bigemina TaxID=5866 RepID=A0A061D372_BABBI|nr:protein kinase domain containing protein, putative [Babesia bigemina]CDR94542.1 protein kinase domain containing protein, putative [Babesia bigemina]|eukprot:XP_012766728.1 protein kinase domain containing protein, putative [Babesia bigemina]